MQTNTGFVDLHNPLGVMMVLFAAFLFTVIIVVGARLVKLKEASDKELRAELRREIEAKKHQ